MEARPASTCIALGAGCRIWDWNFVLTWLKAWLAAGADPWLYLEEGDGVKRWEELGWLASAPTKACGVKISEI